MKKSIDGMRNVWYTVVPLSEKDAVKNYIKLKAVRK